MIQLIKLAKVYQRLGCSPTSVNVLDKMELLLSEFNYEIQTRLYATEQIHDVSVMLQQLQTAPDNHPTVCTLHKILASRITQTSFTDEDLELLSCVYQRVSNSNYDSSYITDAIDNLLNNL